MPICKTCTQTKIAHYAQLKPLLAQLGVYISQPLYHSTTREKAESILVNGFKAKAGGTGNDAYYDNAVCFTRNLEFAKSNSFGDITFILDSRELKSRFHLYPYDWHESSGWAEQHKSKPVDPNNPYEFEYQQKHPDWFEYEERASNSPANAPHKFLPQEQQDSMCLIETVIPAKYIKAILVPHSLHTRLPASFSKYPVCSYVGGHYLVYNFDNKYTGTSDLMALVNKNDYEIAKSMAQGVTTPPEILSTLYNKYSDGGVRSQAVLGYVASNPNTSQDILMLLAYHDKIHVKNGLLLNPELPMEVYETLLKYDNAEDRVFLTWMAESIYTPAEVLSELATKYCWTRHEYPKNQTIASKIIKNPNTPPEIKQRLINLSWE